MKFTKLRLLGFKSFVEPSEFVIERGLTGVELKDETTTAPVLAAPASE